MRKCVKVLDRGRPLNSIKMQEQSPITVPHLKTPKSSVVDGSEERIDRAREIQRGLERRMERRKSQYEVIVANQVQQPLERVTIPETFQAGFLTVMTMVIFL